MASADITVVWDETAVRAWVAADPALRAALDRLAAKAVVTMKALCPVSPVYPVYAQPVPVGASTGQVYRGRGLARPGGPERARLRRAGDLPLGPPSGHLRNSVRAFREPDGSVIIGPTADYAAYVNDGTRPHIIRSHGPWPLRNRATGQVFGPVVHHPGTVGVHFIERTAAALGGTRIYV